MRKAVLLTMMVVILMGFAGCNNQSDFAEEGKEGTTAGNSWYDGKYTAVAKGSDEWNILEPHVWEYIEQVKDSEGILIHDGNDWVSVPADYKFINSEIVGIYFLSEFNDLAEYSIRVYVAPYRLLADDPSKAILAGGRYLDDENWMHDGKYFMLSAQNGAYSYLGCPDYNGSINSEDFKEYLENWIKNNAVN